MLSLLMKQQYIPEMSLILPGLCSIVMCNFNTFTSTLPLLCPDYAPTMPDYALTISALLLAFLDQICPNYAFCLNYVPIFAQTMPQLCFGRLPSCQGNKKILDFFQDLKTTYKSVFAQIVYDC